MLKTLNFIMLLFIFFLFPLEAQESKEQVSTPDAKLPEQSSAPQAGPDDIAEEKKNPGVLKPIVIRARRVSTMEKASTTTTVTTEDIEARSDKLLKDVLLQVPGIQVQEETKGIRTFKMRGYDMSKMAITIDGIPIINAYDGQMDIDNIGIMDASEIIINRGSSSALYGARGTVGSINIIKNEPSELYANASAEYGEHGNYVTSFSNGASIGNFFYYISGVYDKERGYTVSKKLDYDERAKWLYRFFNASYSYDQIYSGSMPYTKGNYGNYLGDKGLWDHVNYEKYKLYGKAGYHVTQDMEIGASAFYNDSKMDKNNVRIGDITWIRDANGTWVMALPADQPLPYKNFYAVWPYNNDYSVSPYMDYRHGNLSVKANAFFYHETNKFIRYGNIQNTDPPSQDMDLITWKDSIWTGETYGINIYPSYRLFDWNRLNFAVSYYTANHTKEFEPHDSASTWIIYDYGWDPVKVEYIEAGYLTLAVEDEIKIMENIDLTLGISYDAQDLVAFQQNNNTYTNHMFDGMPAYLQGKGNRKMTDIDCGGNDSMIWGKYDSFNPVAGIVYEPVKDFLILRGSGSRKTSFPTLQNYANALDIGSDKKLMKPETSYNCNAGFELFLLNKQLTLGMDYFYSRFKNKITKIPSSNPDEPGYANLDAMRQQGAETILKLNDLDFFDIAKVEISLSHTYIRAENLQSASIENPGKRIKDIPEHKFTFDFRLNFITDTSLVIFGNYQYNQIEYTIKSYPSTGDAFSASYYRATRLHDPLFVNIKLSQKIYHNYEVYVMCKNVLDDYDVNPFNPGPGRMWYAGAKVAF